MVEDGSEGITDGDERQITIGDEIQSKPGDQKSKPSETTAELQPSTQSTSIQISSQNKKTTQTYIGSSGDAEFYEESDDQDNEIDSGQHSKVLFMNLIIYEDCKPAIVLTKVDDSTTLRHLVRLSYHYIRDLVKNKKVTIKWVTTDQQLADTFTKALPSDKFIKFRNMLISEFKTRH